MEQKKAKILCIIIAIIIIAGAIVIGVKGFNIELIYSNRQEIVITNNTGLNINEIKEIAESVLENKKVKVQKNQKFENSAIIISEEISEEEKENIVNKVNEKYSADISKDDVNIINVANTRIRDILKPYILPGIITFVIILLYFLIVYNKIGIKKVLLTGIFTPIIVELLYYSIIAITRIPFGRITNSIAIGLYIASIGAITVLFQNEKEKLVENEEKEND